MRIYNILHCDNIWSAAASYRQRARWWQRKVGDDIAESARLSLRSLLLHQSLHNANNEYESTGEVCGIAPFEEDAGDK